MKRLFWLVPLLFVLLCNQSAMAKEWPAKTDVPLDKAWTITFSKPVDMASPSSIHMIEKGTVVPILNTWTNLSDTSFYLYPKDKYKPNTTYILVIPSTIKSSDGTQTLKEPITMEFTTVAPANVPVTKITLSKTSVTLTEREAPYALTATISPDNATDKTLKWSSNDVSIVTIDSGMITPLKPGITDIRVLSSNNVSATCKVTVNAKNISVSDVSLDKQEITLYVNGETATIVATVSPSNAINKKVTWESSNPTVATVNNGIISPLLKGTTTITATTNDGNKTASCIITVQPTPEDPQVAQLRQLERDQKEHDHMATIQDLQEQRKYHEVRTGQTHVEAIKKIDQQITDENFYWNNTQQIWAVQDQERELIAAGDIARANALKPKEKQLIREPLKYSHNRRIADLQEQRRYHELRTGQDHVDAIVSIDKQIATENYNWSIIVQGWAIEDQ